MYTRYTRRRQPLPPLDVPAGVPRTWTGEAEILTGTIQGKRASDIEERSARSITRLGFGFTFKVRLSPLFGLTIAQTNFPGELEIDFLVFYNQLWPFEIDGEIGHFKLPWQKDVDNEKRAKINQAMAAIGARPVEVVPFWRLTTQALSDLTFREFLT